MAQLVQCLPHKHDDLDLTQLAGDAEIGRHMTTISSVCGGLNPKGTVREMAHPVPGFRLSNPHLNPRLDHQYLRGSQQVEKWPRFMSERTRERMRQKSSIFPE